MWVKTDRRIFAHSFQPAASPKALTRFSRDNPQLGAASSQRQIPDRSGRDVQSVHPRLDQLLQPLLQDAVASDPEEDRCLCHSVGASEVQANAPPDQGRREIGLTGYAAPNQRSLPTGRYAMATAEHREPCESRGSCTVLGAPGGEIPPGELLPSRRFRHVRLAFDLGSAEGPALPVEAVWIKPLN